jgi:hypothetical protein
MRYILVILAICSTIIGTSVTSSSRLPQDMNSTYAAAYERWGRTIESHPTLGEPFWVRTDIGPPEMRNAVQELLSFGPNMTPFLVKELRSETDSLRLYRLVLLLNAVAGINLYFNSGAENFYAAAPQMRNRFIKDWDSHKYLQATELLRNEWRTEDQDRVPERIDPKKLTQVIRYGVFAIPFILENIESHNSSELFAAFLIITGRSDLYAEYLQNPSKLIAGRDQKLSLMKSWANENANKLDKLKTLHEEIKALTIR